MGIIDKRKEGAFAGQSHLHIGQGGELAAKLYGQDSDEPLDWQTCVAGSIVGLKIVDHQTGVRQRTYSRVSARPCHDRAVGQNEGERARRRAGKDEHLIWPGAQFDCAARRGGPRMSHARARPHEVAYLLAQFPVHFAVPSRGTNQVSSEVGILKVLIAGQVRRALLIG